MLSCIFTINSDDTSANNYEYNQTIVKGEYFSKKITIDSDVRIKDVSGIPQWMSFSFNDKNEISLWGMPEYALTYYFEIDVQFIVNDKLCEIQKLKFTIKVVENLKSNLDRNVVSIATCESTLGETFTINEDQALHIVTGRYGFKFPGMLFSEQMNTWLNENKHGLVQYDKTWKGYLRPGTYVFKVGADKGSGEFKVICNSVIYDTYLDYSDGIVDKKSAHWHSKILLPQKETETMKITGWIDSDNNMHDPNENFLVKKGQTLKAIWSPKFCRVVFENKGSEILDPFRINCGNKIVLPNPGEKEGYEFIGWYDENNEFIGNENDEYNVKNNTYIHSKWKIHYTITEKIVLIEELFFINPVIAKDVTLQSDTQWAEATNNVLKCKAPSIPGKYTIKLTIFAEEETIESDVKIIVVKDSTYMVNPKTGVKFMPIQSI